MRRPILKLVLVVLAIFGTATIAYAPRVCLNAFAANLFRTRLLGWSDPGEIGDGSGFSQPACEAVIAAVPLGELPEARREIGSRPECYAGIRSWYYQVFAAPTP